MRYEGMIYRPPSEAYSYLLQVTVGCSHNRCTFCSMYKDKRFHVRSMEDILEDLDMARKHYKRVGRIFLCDGDALCLTTEKLMKILGRIEELFPECERVTMYGRASDVLRKTPEELGLLRNAGVGIIYLGAESGSDKVLAAVNKGVTRQEIKDAILKIEASGIKCSVTFISGLGGPELAREHAIESGKLISETEPHYASLLTLMIEKSAPIYEDIAEGRFKLLTPLETLEETKLLIENINVNKECVFRSNHASNYVSLNGTFPQDKAAVLADLAYAAGCGRIKPEYMRGL